MNAKRHLNLKIYLLFSALCFSLIFSPFTGKASSSDLVAEAGPNQEVKVNQTVNFDGSASAGSVVSYLWNFGDGIDSSAVNPAHSFSEVGTYTITLTVSDGIGGTQTDTLTITVENLGALTAPTKLKGYGGDNRVALGWDENTEADLFGYNVYRSIAPGGPYSKINSVVITTNSYNDDAVTNEMTYYYVVTAIDLSFHESGHSNEIEVVTNYTGPTYVDEQIFANRIWTLSGSPYIITDNITVYSGAILTIEPGTVIKFEDGYTLNIQGTILVLGTESDPITFTSAAAAPRKSDWGGISYTDSAGGGFAMDWVIVEYGSYGIKYSTSSSSVAPSISNSIVRYTGGDGIYVYGSGTAAVTLTVSGNQVYGNDGYGIYCYPNGSSVSFNATISGNQIYDNGSYGIYHYVYNSPSGSLFTITDNSIYANTGYGVYVNLRSGPSHSGVIAHNSISASGDGIYIYNIGGPVSGLEIVDNEVHDGAYGIRWNSSNADMVPVISGNRVYANSSGGIRGLGNAPSAQISYNEVYNNTGNGIYVAAGGVCRINYNNIYDNTGYALYNASANTVDGRLNWWGAAATAEMDAGSNPRDITAIYDIYDDGAKGTVDYMGWLSSSLTFIDDPHSQITNPLDGQTVEPGLYTLSGVAAAAAGIDKVEVSVDGGSSWLTAAGTYSWSFSWNIPADGVYHIKSRTTDKAGAVETPGAGVTLTADSTLPTTSGTLTTDETWSGVVQLTGDVVVPAGITLTLEPGTVIKFPALQDDTNGGADSSRSELAINGTLQSLGTESDPITFTSAAAAPRKSDWGGISYTDSAGGGFAMDWVIVEYGSYGIKYSTSSSSVAPSISNSIVRYTGGDGIYVYGSGTAAVTLTVSGNQVYGNDGYGIYCYPNGSSVSFNATISGNQIYDNGSYGIYHYVYNSPSGSLFTITDNSIYANTGYGVYVNLRSGPSHSGVIAHNSISASGDGIYIYNIGGPVSGLEIVDNEVHDGAYGIRWNSSNADMVPVISGNRVYANSSGGIRGLGNAPSAQISYNEVYNNTGNGIYVAAGGVCRINYNNIYDNTGYALYNASANTVDGRLNWWGAAATAEMDAGSNPRDITAIYDIYDDGAKGTVDYMGWLSSSLTFIDDPHSQITNPLDGQTVEPGLYTLSGVAAAAAGIDKVEVSVDGGSSWLTAAGTYSWSFSWNIPADGVYHIKSRTTDKAGAVETPGAGVTLTADSTLPTTSGTLTTDETWSGVVQLTGDVVVPAGITLTLEPGTVIKFPALQDDTNGGADSSRSELAINGTLQSLGTESDPITFTSAAAAPRKSDWGGISYTDSAGGGFAMDWVIVEYGSYGIKYSTSSSSVAPSISNSIVRYTGGDGIYVYGSGTAAVTLTVSGNQVYGNDGYGIYCYPNGSSVSFNATISGNQIYDNGSYGIYHYVYNSPSGSLFTITDNSIYANTGYGVYVNLRSGPSHSGVIAHNSISASGDGIYIYNIGGPVSGLEIVDNEVHDGAYGIRWNSSNADMVPVISGNRVYANSSGGIRGLGNAPSAQISYNEVYNNTGNGIYVAAGGVCRINYNNIYDNTGYALYNASASAVDGRLNWWGAAATAEMDAGSNPRDITAIYDIYDDGAKGTVDYMGWLSSSLTLADDPQSHITYPLDGNAAKSGVNIIYGVAAAAAGIDKVEVSVDGGSSWLTAAGTYSWSFSWNIPADGVYHIKSRTTDKAGAVETPGAGVTLTADSTLPTTSGTLTTDETWSGVVQLTGDVVVPAGITLTLEPGTVIKFEYLLDDTYGGEDFSRGEIIVEGSLIALGTESEPIMFTSNAAYRQPNDWGGVNFSYNGENAIHHLDYVIVEFSKYGIRYIADTGSTVAAIRNSIIRYSGGDGISINTSNEASLSFEIKNNIIQYNEGHGIYCYANGSSILTPTITFNTLTQNSYGIYVYRLTSPDIKNNDIHGNLSYGIFNAYPSYVLNAGLNWWGDASGPSGKGPGSGDPITNGVAFNPWIGEVFTQPFNIIDAAVFPIKFSQNGGTASFTASFSDEADWAITLQDQADLVVRNFNGTGDSIDQDWNGEDINGDLLGDGIYSYKIEAASTITSQIAAPVIGFLELDGNIPIAEIASPKQGEIIGGGIMVTIAGTADATELVSWNVKYGLGEYPSSWTTLASGDSPVIDGILATWNTAGLNNRYYTIKLTVTDASSHVTEYSTTINLFSIYNVSDNPDPFSPNSDGVRESTAIGAVITMPGTWEIIIKDSLDATVKTFNGSGSSISQVWNGTDSSSVTLSDDTYTYQINATEPFSGVTTTSVTGTVKVDTTYPAAAISSPAADALITGSIDLYIIGTAADADIASYMVEYAQGATPATWTLIHSSSGSITEGILATWSTMNVENGDYTIRLTVTDKAGNFSARTIFVTVDNIKVTNVSAAPVFINPALDQQSVISFELDRAADVTLELYRAFVTIDGYGDGHYQREFQMIFKDSQPKPAGANSIIWNGKDLSGNVIEHSAYVYVIKAHDGNDRSGVYDPEYVQGLVTISDTAITPSYNPYANETVMLQYTLLAPAWVTIGGDIQKFIIEGEPRDLGENTEIWDGRDGFGNIVETVPNLAAKAVILPENAVVLRDKTLNLTDVSAEAFVITPSYGELSTVKYVLSKSAQVSIIIRDPNGNNWTLQMSEQQDAGLYEVEWDGTDGEGKLVWPWTSDGPQGDYAVEITAFDAQNNTTVKRTANIHVYR